MPIVRRVSLIDQTALHLREGLRAGRWKERLPGLRPLADELKVSRHTLRAAVGVLVMQGVLKKGGDGDAYSVVDRSLPEAAPHRRALRIALLLLEPLVSESSESQVMLMEIVTRLKSEGHDSVLVTFPSGKDSHKTGYLPRMVADAGADAWMVVRGTREVLEWFVAARLPVLALGGRAKELPVAAAGFDGDVFVRLVVRRLVELGHRRIVMISPHLARRPVYGRVVQSFGKELEAAGIKVGEYHNPDWEETPGGLCRLLDSLFRVTPPTALICVPIGATQGALSWAARRGIRIPTDLTLVSWLDDPALAWHFPGLRPAHSVVDDVRYVKIVLEWVSGVAEGKPPLWQRLLAPRLEEGNTMGPVKPGA